MKQKHPFPPSPSLDQLGLNAHTNVTVRTDTTTLIYPGVTIRQDKRDPFACLNHGSHMQADVVVY
ncbi:hypothetical protein Pmani_018167, partial [Petrolisthes manimaculis]